MKNPGNQGPGEKIPGDLRCFKGSQLEISYNEIVHSGAYAPLDQFDKLREALKDCAGILFENALTSNKKSIHISENAVDAIYAELSVKTNVHTAGFVHCALQYYRGTRIHCANLNLDNLQYRAQEVEKAVAQACAHLKKAEKGYVKKVITMLKAGKWENIRDYDYWIQKYNAIEPAVNFLCTFFTKITKKVKLPQIIGEAVYVHALILDPNLNRFYTPTSTNIYKTKKETNATFDMVKPECAAYLICSTLYP